MITKIWRNLCAHGRSLKVNDDHDLWVLAAIKTVRILSWKPLYGRGHKAIDKCRLIFFWGGGGVIDADIRRVSALLSAFNDIWRCICAYRIVCVHIWKVN